MTYSSGLADDLTPLVLDTSVLINLYASTHGARILGALPNDIFIPQIVADELANEASKTNSAQEFVENMVATHAVRLVDLDETELKVFRLLVSGNLSLGDGEAATIAIAASRGRLPIIDERKGRLQAQSRIPGNCAGWSVDLFCHPRVARSLGTNQTAVALYHALRDGRMRIHEDHCDHVVALIGVQRALECNSLPGYKVRRQRWQHRISLQGTTNAPCRT